MRNRCLPNLFGRAAHARLFVLAVFALTASFAEAAAEFVENLKAGRRQKIVCYGTSLTVSSHWWVDGLAAALEARWPGQATVVNAGLSGKNSATGLSLVQSKVVAAEPDAVLIEFSMNDAADSLNSGKTPAEALAAAEANLKAIIAAVRSARPAAEIILQTMNPYVAASRGYVDDVIIPADTRKKLIKASTADAIHRSEELFDRVAAGDAPVYQHSGAAGCQETAYLGPGGGL